MMIDEKCFADLVKSIDRLEQAVREQCDADAKGGNHLAALRCCEHADELEAILNQLAMAVGTKKEDMLQGVNRWEAACEETIRREGYDLFDLMLGDAKLPSLADSLNGK